VADVLTPIADYDRHAETYLDWTYLLPDGYEPPDLVFALTGAPRGPALRAVELPRPADLLLRRGDPAYLELLADDRQALVRAIVYEDLTAMRGAATAAGVRLVVLSAYRSYARQVATFDYWVGVSGYERALDASARPGHSEHQLGTTIDFGDAAAAPWEYADWAGTPSGAWLRDHAREFGFVMSYPSGSRAVTCYDYEPWHYRWIGRALAAEVVARGVPLREYQAGGRR
jgi:LAS superfamily LD-carboxypeptidase LdcB